MVVDSLLIRLNNNGFNTLGYADDLVVTIRGTHDQTLSQLMQKALNCINQWCLGEGLQINPNKTIIVPFTKRRKINLKAPSLGGIAIQYSTEVKYLGVVLDQKLTWNPHLEHVRNKATKAFWICRRLLGKNWGLKPKMIYWIYLTIIRPMLTYGAVVWWTKICQKTAQKTLQSVQRLACLSMTGAMRTCPTAALEVLLNLPPLHIHVKKEAISAALRISNMGKKLNQGDMTGHRKILMEFPEYELVSTLLDVMPTKYIFKRPYRVVIPDRSLWLNGELNLETEAHVWYTDGSLMNGRVGAGVYGSETSIKKALGAYPSIFQAETHAIEACALEVAQKRLIGAKIYIMSDSQAALKALSCPTIESKLVWDCITALRQLENNKVTLMWVPGHEGIMGNEIADSLAREGGQCVFYGPEPFCVVPKCYLKDRIRRWETKQKVVHWNNITGHKHSKVFLKHSKKRTEEILLLNKQEIRHLTGLLTGHCTLRYHLKKMGIADDDRCRFCQECPETAEHVICSCVALMTKRLQHLEEVTVEPSDAAQLQPKRILAFIDATGILRDE